MKNQMMPQSYAELERWAAKAAATDFVPKEYRGKPESVLICAQYAMEIGLGIVEGLRSIAVINGKPSLYGDGLIALCQSSPVCEYIKEQPILNEQGEITGYICEAKRKGRDATFARFTLEDAKRAKLAGKQGPWQEYPQRMLQMRARGFALRDAFPDVLKGLISREEADDYPPETIDNAPVNVPPRITAEQIEDIKRLTAALSFDEHARMLEWVGAKTLEEIPASEYTRLINTLSARQKRMEGTRGEG